MKTLARTALLPALLFSALPLFAQEPNPTSVAPPQGAVVTQSGDIFFYKVNVVRRDIDAVNYLHRSGSTRIDFVGTNLLPGGSGKAEVKSERGKITVDADFRGLTPANGFGPEYLTYVLWAISPDGSPKNLGEVLPAGTKNNISVSVPIQAFGLIVTAEPYYDVATPSDIVVLKNVFTDQTNGILEHVDAHATLLPRGYYAEETDGSHTVSHPITRNEHSPLELYEAYNAVRIAQASGADKYSSEIYAKAQQDLQNAADIDGSKHRDEKMEITDARAAVERAEDSRVDTLRKRSAERQQQAQQAAVDATAAAAASAEQAQQSQQQADRSRQQAEEARLAQQQAQLQTQQALMAKQQADEATAKAQAAEAAANSRAESAEATREKLRAQLNAVLQTTLTARGLVVNLSDVLFDTGKSNLKAATQVSLARIAGILQAYPSLMVQVEGYTDSTGSDELNQKLSENRASTTASFLVAQGVAQSNVTSAGYGKADPVADNTTNAGRAQNRRVNLVVSGAAIGIQQSAPTTNQ